jgi:DeoR family transcriptional regulator, suf operon transcriptional repressor
VETTRDQVLRLVRGHKQVTVARVAETLGLSQHAVRRHLDGLRADGFVDAGLERHGVGRPSLVYFATERGADAGGKGYFQLMSRLFRRLDKMGEAEVSGGSGRDVLQRAFAGLAFEVAEDHRVEVQGLTLNQRVVEASEALKREGIVDGWQKHGEEFRLVNGECPYLRLAEMTDAPCRSDRHSIELLVRAPVDQLRRIVDGEPICEYIVRPEPLSIGDGQDAQEKV